MKDQSTLLVRGICGSLLVLLTGCVPIPHTTERSPEVCGRVLDARTRAPIQGAKVFLIQAPDHAAYTDVSGYFQLKAARNFHLAYVLAGERGHWPERKVGSMEIYHPNYLPVCGGWSGNVGDILLKPTH